MNDDLRRGFYVLALLAWEDRGGSSAGACAVEQLLLFVARMFDLYAPTLAAPQGEPNSNVLSTFRFIVDDEIGATLRALLERRADEVNRFRDALRAALGNRDAGAPPAPPPVMHVVGSCPLDDAASEKHSPFVLFLLLFALMAADSGGGGGDRNSLLAVHLSDLRVSSLLCVSSSC